MTDSLKIALAQINPTVGDIEGNLALIRRRRAEAAARGALRDPRLRDGGLAPQRTRGAVVPHPLGRALFAASGVAHCLQCPALRRNALLTGGKNRPEAPRGETGQYRRPLV